MCYSKFDLQGEKNLRQCAQTNVLELALEKHWLVTERKKNKSPAKTQMQELLTARKSDESIAREYTINSSSLK